MTSIGGLFRSEMNLSMHSSVGGGRGWRRLEQVLLGFALFGGALLAIAQAFGDGAGVSSRIFHSSLAWLLWPVSLLAAAAVRNLEGWQQRLARFGLFLATAGVVLSIAVVLLAVRGDAYSSALPILGHPLHGAALGLFGLGIVIALVARAGSLLLSAARGGGLVWYAVLPIVAAAFSVLWAWSATAELEGPVRLSYVFWGAANLVPFLFSLLVMLGWLWLLGDDAAGWRARVMRHGCLLLAAVPSLIVVPIQLEVAINDPEYFVYFDRLVMLAAWPAAALLLIFLLPALRGAWRAGRRVDAAVVLVSAGLFFLGAFIGWGGDDTGTVFRAHTHLSAGALLLVSQALGDRWGGPGDARNGAVGLSVWQVPVFGVAFVALAGGVGFFGLAERWWSSVPDAAYGVAKASIALSGVALVATFLAGGQARSAGAPVSVARLWRWLVGAYVSIDLRIRAALATVTAIVVVGAVIASLPEPGGGAVLPVGPGSGQDDPHRHVVEKQREEVRLRFEQGVAMLHARRYDDAATAFHRVLQLAPQMPEAHVNMGFAMLGVKDYKVARDFFEGAIELRTSQLNAYYGLALAYEGLGNFEGAIGAMRTFQHLIPPDDPYLPQAVAKLRVYQAQRSQGSGGASLRAQEQ